MDVDPSSGGRTVLPTAEFGALLEWVAGASAPRSLHEFGLDGTDASENLHGLRFLLAGFRFAKQTTVQTAGR